MKKQLFTSIFLLHLITCAYAQLDIEAYLNYEYPDLKRHELSFDLNFTGGLNSDKSNDTLINDDSFRNHFSNELTGTYTYFKNSRKYQGIQTIDLQASQKFHGQKTDELHTKNIVLLEALSFSSSNRMYFKEKWFYELNVTASAYLEHYDSKTVSDIDSLQSRSFVKDGAYNFSTSIAIGKGRIEDITDVIHALVLLKNLKKNKCINNYPSAEEIQEFSKFIAQLKNKRILDSRQKKIRELEQVDSFFRANNFLDKDGIRYFTTLEDIWMYAGNYYRSYGNRLSLDILTQPGYEGLWDEFDLFNAFRLTPHISFLHTKPINLKIQSNVRVYSGLDFTFFSFPPDANDNSEGDIRRTLFLGASYSFEYYPNTRTVFQSGVYSNFNNLNDTQFSAALFLNCYYYIAPQFRLFFDTSVLYDSNRYSSDEFYDRRYSFDIEGGLQIYLK